MNTNTTVYLIKRARKSRSGSKRADYYLMWTHHGSRSSRSLGPCAKISRREAQAARREQEQKIAAGTVPTSSAAGRMLLSEFIRFHEQAFGDGKRPTTIIEWRIAGNHAIDALGDRPIGSITWDDAGRIRAHLEGKARATVQKTLRTLRAMLGRAAKRKLIRENPFAEEEIGAAQKRPKRIFAAAELDALVEAAPTLELEVLVRVAYLSGLRKAEMLHLRWTDLDLDAGTLRVEPHFEDRFDANGTDVPILAWEPKTKSSIRTVPIPSEAVEALRRLRMTQGDGSPYPFVSAERLRQIDARVQAGTLRPNFDLGVNFTQRFDAIQLRAQKILAESPDESARTLAGSWRHGCFHDLRKTFGTRAASAGVPMHELQGYMGHSSITTTSDFYCGIEEAAADRLRAAFERTA